jgi:hypothetical protein
MYRRSVTLVGLCLWITACGETATATVEDACDVVSNCDDLTTTDCVENGAALEEESASLGCESEFAEYIGCVADAGCNYAIACEDQASAVEACGVSLSGGVDE